MKIKRTLLLISVIIFCITNNCCMSFAFSVSEIPKIKINEFPENINLYVNQNCSGHTYFLQADANENGDFVVLSHKEKYDKKNNDIFDKKYVDIYNSEGEFCFELVFTTKMNPVLRMDGDILCLIFNNNLLTFDIETEELNYYDIPGNELWEYTNSEISQEEEFTVGAWKYKCVRNMKIGFVKLIRSNDEQSDVLIEMSGVQLKDFYGVFFGIVAIIIIIAKKTIKGRLGKKTEDSSMS